MDQEGSTWVTSHWSVQTVCDRGGEIEEEILMGVNVILGSVFDGGVGRRRRGRTQSTGDAKRFVVGRRHCAPRRATMAKKKEEEEEEEEEMETGLATC